ncbi:MAG: thiamine pyrophosphate-dependent enzyme [Gemmatimonadota bacterium]
MSDRMPLTEAVAIVRDARGPIDIVISSMGTAREWLALGPLHPLDFVYVPSAMGHAASLGLGLALAQPTRRVIALMGDGSLLMNLGSLATIAAARPQNLVVIVFDNGVYEVTGAQPTPATVGVDRSRVDYATVARACGITSVQSFANHGEWKSGIVGALDARGPTVVVLSVAPVPGAVGPKSPGPTNRRSSAFIAAVRSS